MWNLFRADFWGILSADLWCKWSASAGDDGHFTGCYFGRLSYYAGKWWEETGEWGRIWGNSRVSAAYYLSKNNCAQQYGLCQGGREFEVRALQFNNTIEVRTNEDTRMQSVVTTIQQYSLPFLFQQYNLYCWKCSVRSETRVHLRLE